jgi:acyl-CoA reductase-like NAD-dependent aldehyde dehydrogenase
VRDGKIYPRCPADGQPLQTGPILPATPEDIDRAVSSAASAQRAWSQTTFVERRRVLKTLLQYVLSNQEEIAAVCCLDSGKTKIDASFGEILVTAEKLAWTSQHGEAALAPSRRPTNLLMCYKSNTVHYEPLGVVAACVSWNYPFHNLISPVISALFAGNAIVVKPSEQTAWSSLYFTSIIHGALEACGHSPDLLQTIICLPEVADHLTSHPTIKHITFIGSRPVAHKVAASASKSLTALTIELGGKDPAIVLEDARIISDLENVTSILLRGTFQSAGQNCIGIERVIALPGIHDKLLAHVIPKIKALTLGNVLHDELAPDIGAMISSSSFPRLEALIASAVKEGAILHCGGRSYNHPKYPRGTYFQPTLLSNITPIMEIAQTELFAPVFLFMRATSVSHAIEMANSTQYALGVSIFGHHPPDVRRCVSEIKAGNVAVNDFGAFYVCSMPFGGRDGSGYGRFGGEEGLKGLCNIKSVCEDSWWAKVLGAKTQIPLPLRYPVDGRRGWQVCKGVVQTGYGIGAMQMIKGVGTLLANLMRGAEETREREATKKVERLSRDW